MILNQPCNNLKFSLRQNESNNSVSGILNQKPMIITKDRAYNFQVLDRDKLKLAQLLAKRDLKSLKETESTSNQSSAQNYMKATDPKVAKRNEKSKTKAKCVTSMSRIPGPSIPVPSPPRQRSPSPPVSNVKQSEKKPKERIKQVEFKKKKPQKVFPKPSQHQLNSMEKRMTDYSSKLDHLEALLMQQSHQPTNAPTSNAMSGTMTPIMPGTVQGKSRTREELDILTEKLQKLMSSKIPQANEICPPVGIPQIHNNQSESLIARLDMISARINEVKMRYNPQSEFAIGYEYVDAVSSDGTTGNLQENDQRVNNYQNYSKNNACEGIRLTKPIQIRNDPDDESNDYFPGADDKPRLFVPINLIRNLDDNRKSFARFQAKQPVVSMKFIDWSAEDLTNDIIEQVMNEFDKASAEVVHEVLQAELTPGDDNGEMEDEETKRNRDTMDTY